MTWIPGTPVNLETENYILRSLTRADATDEYISWWNDAEVQASLGFPPRGWAKEQAVAHITKFDNRGRVHLGIFPKGQDLPIGFFSIIREANLRAVTNVVIGNKDYWGKAVVREVRPVCLDFIFNEMHLEKVVGKVNANNYPSIFNYKALKYKTEGVLRHHTKDLDGNWIDEVQFGMLRDEWLEIRKDLK